MWKWSRVLYTICSSPEKLLQHMVEPFEIVPKTGRYTCRTCKRAFKTQDNLEQHFWCLTSEDLEEVIQTVSYELKNE